MDEINWLQTIISAGAGILGGVFGAMLTNKRNLKIHKNQIKTDVQLAIRKETNEEQKVINDKVLNFIRNNPNCVKATVTKTVRGDNKNLEEEWPVMASYALEHLLLEDKIEIRNPDQMLAMYKEYKVK
ncbi:hypothetical protein [Bacillus tropicus]|uniref:hypothetical protein n=1 Tax=Bacillus tropicus TaxID=2026188 RepID=UPI003D9AB07C